MALRHARQVFLCADPMFRQREGPMPPLTEAGPFALAHGKTKLYAKTSCPHAMASQSNNEPKATLQVVPIVF